MTHSTTLSHSLTFPVNACAATENFSNTDLNPEQLERFRELLATNLLLIPKEEYREDLWVVRRGLGEFLSYLLSMPPCAKIQMIGGAAGWVVSGNSFQDVDFAIFDSEKPYETFLDYKLALLNLVGYWVNFSCPYGKRPLSNDEIFDIYFYKTSDKHLCLSFGNIDLKIMKPGARTHLFGDDALCLDLHPGEIQKCKVGLVPHSLNSDLDFVIDLSKKKILHLPKPESAYGYHFRVFKKFSEDYLVDEEIIDFALYHMYQTFIQNPFSFKESLRFFCLNHLKKENALNFKLNFHNGIFFNEKIPEALKDSILALVNEELDLFLGYYPQNVCWDPYKELLNVLSSGLRENPEKLFLRPNAFSNHCMQFYMPKPFLRSVEDILHFIPQDPETDMRVLGSALRLFFAQPLASHPEAQAFIQRAYDIYLENYPLTQEVKAKWDNINKTYSFSNFRHQDPFEELKKLSSGELLSKEVFEELMPECIQSGKYSEEELRGFLLKFPPDHGLEEKRIFLRKFYLDPAKRISFSEMEKLLTQFFNERAYEEFLGLYPRSFFEQSSRFIEDDLIDVDSKINLLLWIERNRFFDRLSWRALERYEIFALSMKPSKAALLFFKKEENFRFFSWIEDAYRNNPQAMLFFENLKKEADNTKDLTSYCTLIFSLETKLPFSINTLKSLEDQKLSPLGGKAISFLRIFYLHDSLEEERLLKELQNLDKESFVYLKEIFFKILSKAASEQRTLSKEFLAHLFKDLKLETILGELNGKFDAPTFDKILFDLKERIEFPHPKNREFVPAVLKFSLSCPSFTEKNFDSSLMENLSRLVSEHQLLEVRGEAKNSAYRLLVLKKGMRAKFQVSLDFKLEVLRVSDPSEKIFDRAAPLLEILHFVEELLVKQEHKSLCCKFLISYGKQSKENALNVLHLLANLEICPVEILDPLETILKNFNEFKLPHKTKGQLQTLFRGTRLESFFDSYKPFEGIKEGIDFLKSTPIEAFQKDPRVLRVLFECIDENIEREDMESLLNLLNSPSYINFNEDFFQLLTRLIDRKELMSSKSENLMIQILMGVMEKGMDQSFDLFFRHRQVLLFLDQNLMKISKVFLRLSLFKRLFLSEEFVFDPNHLAVITSLLNKKNRDLFFRDFIDDSTLLKCFTIYQGLESPSEFFSCLLSVLSNPQIFETVSFETIAKGLEMIFSLPDFQMVPFSNQVDLFMLYERTNKELEPKLFREAIEKLEKDSLRPDQVDWLVDHFFTQEQDPKVLGLLGSKFIRIFLFSKENISCVVKVLDVLSTIAELTEEQADAIAKIVMERELTHPDLIEGMTKFLDRFEETLFFPGSGKFRDLAFLYQLSQREPNPAHVEKMDSRLGVYLQDLGSIKGECLERITLKIVSGFASYVSSRAIVPHLDLLRALLAPISKKKSYSTAWLKIFISDSSLVLSKKGGYLSFEEAFQGLTTQEILSLIEFRCYIFQNKVEKEEEIFSSLQMLRKCSSLGEQDGFTRVLQTSQIVATLHEKFPKDAPFLEEVYKNYQEALIQPHQFDFYLDALFNALVFGIETIKKLQLKSPSERDLLKLSKTLALSVETTIYLSQYHVEKNRLDFRFLNPIFRDCLGELKVDHFLNLINKTLNTFIDLLKVFPDEFDDQKEDIHQFFEVFVNQLFIKRAGKTVELLKDSFRFFGNAARAKDVFYVHLSVDLILSFFNFRMDLAQIEAQEELIRAEGDLFSRAYESTIKCIFDFYDKNLYSKAQFIYEQYKVIFRKGLPAVDQRFVSELIYYDLDLGNVKKMLKVYDQHVMKKITFKEKLQFMQKIAGRVLFLLDNVAGWKNKEFIQSISVYYEKTAQELFEERNLSLSPISEVSQTVLYLYGSLVGSLVENAVKSPLKDDESRKAHLEAAEICLVKVQHLMDLLPQLNIPGLSPIFAELFPKLEMMLGQQFIFSDKDPQLAKQKSWVRTKFLEFMIKGIHCFNTSCLEIVDFTALLFRYLEFLQKEILNSKSLIAKRLYQLERARAIVGCGLWDVVQQILTTDEEYLFFIEHFLENLDSIAFLEETRKKEILTQFTPRILQWAKEKLSLGTLEKLRPLLDKISHRSIYDC